MRRGDVLILQTTMRTISGWRNIIVEGAYIIYNIYTYTSHPFREYHLKG
jgi:hypothetical protein